MSSQLAVPDSPERTIRRQPSATRITVSTVRPVAPAEPKISVETATAFSVPDVKNGTVAVAAPLKPPSAIKTRNTGSKLRARPRAYNARTFSEGEESDDASEHVVSDDDDDDVDEDAQDDDDEEEEDDSDSDSDHSSADADAPGRPTPGASGHEGDTSTQRTQPAAPDSSEQHQKAAAPAAAPVAAAAAATSPQRESRERVTDDSAAASVASLPTQTSTDATSSTGGKLSWAAIAEEDDDGEMEAFGEEMVAEEAAAKAAKAAASAQSPPQAASDASPAAAALAAKERKKAKAKERKLRKKAEIAAAAAAKGVDSKSNAPAPAARAQATPSATASSASQRAVKAATNEQVQGESKEVQDNYRDRLAKDPTYTPRLGNFWGHDERLIDGDMRRMSGWWRGRGGRGGGRGGRGGAHSESRAGVASHRDLQENPASPAAETDASAQSERVPPHLRQNGATTRGSYSIRGAASAPARGGRGGGRGGFAARALGPGAFGAYAPGPAPPGRSKLRGWDDEDDFDDSASVSDVPKVDYDALEGKAVKEPPRAARPPPQPSRSTWGDDAVAGREQQRGAKADPVVRGSGPTLSGVPTAPRAMLKAAAEAAAAAGDTAYTATETTPAKQLNGIASAASTSTADASAADSQPGFGGKWAHDGFAELQRSEVTRGAKRGGRGGASAGVGCGGSVAASKSGPTGASRPASEAHALTAPSGIISPSQRVASPAESVSSPHRNGVPLDGKGGVFVPQSASRSNSVAGRDSPVVFGSVHESATGYEEGGVQRGANPRAEGFALAQGSDAGVSVRLPPQQPAAQRPSLSQQSQPGSSTSGPQPPYVSYAHPGQVPSQGGTASPYPVAQPVPVTMAPSLPPGFAVDSTGMVFNLTGGQPVAVGYLSAMPTPSPMGAYYPGPYGEDPYAGGSPAQSVYQPSSYQVPASSNPSTSKPALSPSQSYQAPAATSPLQSRSSPKQEKREAPRALPPHMQQPGSTRSTLGKHARTISTLPASAAKVPAFRPSASPAPTTASAGSDVPHFVPQQRQYHEPRQNDGQALLEHAMSQTHISNRNGYGTPMESGTSSPYGLDAYAARITPPMGTVYFQPPPVGDASGYGNNPYAPQGYGSPAYYGGAEIYDNDPYFAAAYDQH